jgi:hypothetical protein
VYRRWLPAALVLTAVLGLACGGGGDDNNDADSTATAEAQVTPTAETPADPAIGAVQSYVETELQSQFVPNCAEADAATDAGKVCATLQGERESMRAYVIGQTFSEVTEWVIVEERSGSWEVVATKTITSDTAGIPGIPWPLRTGVDLVVAGSEPCLNVREAAGLNALAVDCINDGTTIQLAAGPEVVDDIEWWQVDGRAGWVSGDYLRYPDAAGQPAPGGGAPAPTAAPTVEPTRGPVLP